MSNNSTTSSCILDTPSMKSFMSNLEYAGFVYVKPTCLAFGIVGHLVSLVAFYKQSKTKNRKMYAFQLYESVAKLLNSFVQTLYILRIFGLTVNGGADWFRRSYFLVWWSGHMSLALTDMASTFVLLLSLITSVDRALAIAQPLKYKDINRRRWEAAGFGLPLVISVCASLFVCFNMEVRETAQAGVYTFASSSFSATRASTALAFVRTVVWIVGVAGTTSVGFCLVYLYNRRHNQVSSVSGSRATAAVAPAAQRDTVKRKALKVLFVLTVFYSVQGTLEMSILITQTMLVKYQPGFQECGNALYTPIRFMIQGFITASDFYLLLIVSKNFRGMIRRALSRQ